MFSEAFSREKTGKVKATYYLGVAWDIFTLPPKQGTAWASTYKLKGWPLPKNGCYKQRKEIPLGRYYPFKYKKKM